MKAKVAEYTFCSKKWMRICDIMVERFKMYLALFLDNFNLGQAQFNNLCGACNRLDSDRLNASLDLLHGANRLSGEHRVADWG